MRRSLCLVLGALGAEAFAPQPLGTQLGLRGEGLRLSTQHSALSTQHSMPRFRGARGAEGLRMGLFDGLQKALNNAMANEDLPPPPPDGLSQDPWLNGMRKNIKLCFISDGEVVGEVEVLPGDKVIDCAKKAGVQLKESAVLNANEESVTINTATARIPATARKNVIADEALRDGDEIMATGISAPVFTNYASRGEVRTVAVEEFEYSIEI